MEIGVSWQVDETRRHSKQLSACSDFRTVLMTGPNQCENGANPEQCPLRQSEALNMEKVVLRMKEISGDLKVLRCSLRHASLLADGVKKNSYSGFSSS